MVDYAEVETLATVHELYAWAGVEGDVLGPRSVRGLFHRALGSPSNIGDLAFVPSPDLEDVLRDLRVPALTAYIAERPLTPVERARARRALADAGTFETVRPPSAAAEVSTGAPAPAASKKT